MLNRFIIVYFNILGGILAGCFVMKALVDGAVN